MPPARDLTPKQQRFVEEYLVDLNATAAAARAGYRDPNKGRQLVTKSNVAAAIQARRQILSRKVEITQERWLQELRSLAFSDCRRLFHTDGSLRAPHTLEDDVAAAVAQVETLEEFHGRGDNRVQIGFTRKVKLWDKLAALDKIGKHFGWLKDRVQHEGSVLIQTVAGVDPAAVLGQLPPGQEAGNG